MLYILDAHNVIGKLSLNSSFGDVRRSLLRKLLLHPLFCCGRNRFLVVFDGKRNAGIISEFKVVDIAFSGEITADEWIYNFLHRNRDKAIIVVSDDNEVRRQARRLGADWISVKEFWNNRNYPLNEDKDLKKKDIPKSVADEITRQMEEIWLKKKGS